MKPEDVFINCPFSADYDSLFKAIVFTVMRSGFTPRCAREDDDAGDVRFEKICNIIAECRYGIHDISKTEPDAESGLPRFNMPLELGLFLGARKFGGEAQASKKSIIFDREAFRYQQFISDIAGQDIHAHGGNVTPLITETAGWLRRASRRKSVPGGALIADEYARFIGELPAIAAQNQLTVAELTYVDFQWLVSEWLLQ